MATTRKQDMEAMATTLEVWQGQIADLQAKAMTAGAERQQVMRQHIAALRQRRAAYKALMADTLGASAAVRRDMLPGAECLAVEFRRLYLQMESRFSD
jgi:hypothetical protein